MKSSLALHIKSWTSRIHPPLARTPRESQQLLSALISSFRRQLDEQHPPIQEEHQKKRTSGKREDVEAKPMPRSAASANYHMQFILDHPLFGPPKPEPRSFEVASGLQGSGILGKVRMLHDPMAYFDQIVAMGSATAENIGSCLEAQRKASLNSSEIDTRESMRKSGAGSRVVRWFTTTTDDNKAAFLKSGAVRKAVPFLLAEGLHDVFWRWIVTPRTLDSKSPSDVLQMQRNVMLEFLRGEIGIGEGATGAIDMFLKAASRSPIFLVGQKPIKSPLPAAGLYLTKVLVDSKRKNGHISISEEQFEGFSRAQKQLCPFWKDWSAALVLCHPSRPDPTQALNYIRSGEPIPTTSNERLRNQRLHLYLDTAQVLLGQNRFEEADFVLGFVKTSFLQAEVDIYGKKERTSAQDLVNAAMLEKLDLGHS
jgi:hypothetical protein